MALWLVRGGEYGEYEQKFIEESYVYLTWKGLNRDLGQLEKQEVRNILEEIYPDSTKARINNFLGQVWSFSHEGTGSYKSPSMQVGDWIAMPRKGKSGIAFAEIAGKYEFVAGADDPFSHRRKVKWLAEEVPRSVFDQDILYSLGAFMTVCRIERNDAEKRVRAMAAGGWKSSSAKPVLAAEDDTEETEPLVDLERLARDQIAKALIAKYKGHGLARLVEAILKVQGYTTYRAPEGPDKGVDILAAPAPMGFGRPRICVQVKSSETPIDLPTLNQLIGAMQNVQAEQGLLVSWGGFKSSIDKEVPAQFFRVRLWDQDALIDEFLNHYEKIEEKLRAEIPLKRFWTLASTEEAE